MTKHYKTIIKEITEVEYNSCDACGQKSDPDLYNNDLGEIKIIFNYGSDYDGFIYTGHICDKDFEKLLQLLPNLKRTSYL